MWSVWTDTAGNSTDDGDVIMAGVMPRVALLLTKGTTIIGHFNNYSEIAYLLGIEVDNGQIIFMGNKVMPQYCVNRDEASIVGNEWTSTHDIVKDWSRYHMRQHMHDYIIYKYIL